jgi:hypothetical protein
MAPRHSLWRGASAQPGGRPAGPPMPCGASLLHPYNFTVAVATEKLVQARSQRKCWSARTGADEGVSGVSQ